MLRSLANIARFAAEVPANFAILGTANASRFSAGKAGMATKAEDEEFDARDMSVFLAQQMQKEAGKNQTPLKQDVLKIIDLLEDGSPDPDAPYTGKLKDALPFMGKRSRNELFRGLMEEEEMKNMHPALGNVMNKLSEVGELSYITNVVYKYMELIDGKTGPGGTIVEMVLASQETPTEVENKKLMLVQDMITKGMMSSGDPVEWKVRVDPEIQGGAVFNLGDVIVDCSVKSLKAEFYENLASAGIARVE